jgi:4-hydroxy-tetrahydrodipicolinate reductase
MGRTLLRLLADHEELQLHAAVAGADDARLGHDSGVAAGLAPNGVPLVADLDAALRGARLCIDFSVAAAAIAVLRSCATAGVPLLLGTTGLPPEAEAAITAAAQRVPVLVAANTSTGVAVLEALVRMAAARLPPGFDVRILDVHHRAKRDAPSGTALALGAAAGEGRGGQAQVGYASLRGGDAVGRHEVQFLGQGERLVLAHEATDRDIFGRGALAAGLWLCRQGPGRYRMADVQVQK